MNTFYRLAILTLLLSFSVILAGGIVRTTGSGMGCPDWPKCFGQYIPPTDISQLPPNYKAIFKVKGKEIADFDAFKTWVEYINRLLGAILGVAILLLTLFSVRLRKRDVWITPLCIALLLVTGFVGWLGSVVVATDLEPVKITIHMMTSIVIIALATTIVHRANLIRSASQTKETIAPVTLTIPSVYFYITALVLFLTLAQIILGTQVREQIDTIAKMLEGRWREQWVEQLSQVFVVHRSLSWLVAFANGYLIWRIAKLVGLSSVKNALLLRRLAMALGSLIIGEIAIGVMMAYWAIPKAAQPLHLLCAMLLIAVQWRVLIIFWTANRKKV